MRFMDSMGLYHSWLVDDERDYLVLNHHNIHNQSSQNCYLAPRPDLLPKFPSKTWWIIDGSSIMLSVGEPTLLRIINKIMIALTDADFVSTKIHFMVSCWSVDHQHPGGSWLMLLKLLQITLDITDVFTYPTKWIIDEQMIKEGLAISLTLAY